MERRENARLKAELGRAVTQCEKLHKYASDELADQIAQMQLKEVFRYHLNPLVRSVG